jgi:hypothetical protein
MPHLLYLSKFLSRLHEVQIMPAFGSQHRCTGEAR